LLQFTGIKDLLRNNEWLRSYMPTTVDKLLPKMFQTAVEHIRAVDLKILTSAKITTGVVGSK
jgi:hypothetical protein